MSSFICEYCGKAIIDSGPEYTTFCPHYPNSVIQYESHKEWLRMLEKKLEMKVLEALDTIQFTKEADCWKDCEFVEKIPPGYRQ